MEPAPSPLASARSTQPYRERLLADMADLCAASPRARDPGVRERLGSVFLRVLAGADLDTRRRFADRVGAADWASPELALRLAKDRPEVAEPVLTASAALGEPELRHVLEVGEAEHRAAIARRPGLSPRLAAAVCDTGEPLALAALAANGGADLPAPVLSGLVERARTLVALRAPLARRADLSAPLAARLAGWVGEELRAELAERFDLSATDAPPPPGDGEDTDVRLVDKLQAAGQLRAGFLLRSLREGRLGVFQAALSALAARPATEVAATLRAPTPEPLADACLAAGVDRSVFPTLLAGVRGLTGGLPGGASPLATEGDAA